MSNETCTSVVTSCSDRELSEDHEDCKDKSVTGSSCRALKNAVANLYRLDDFYCELIGTGFFSEVFKVTHKVSGRVMVLKMNLLSSNQPNMLKEVQLMNQLSHPNILGFMGVCVHKGQLHALTEYINGGRLEQIIQNRTIELPYCLRIKLALDIARGMEYLHSKDVFHRDLTSKNILVRTSRHSSEMTAVVGDFGFAAKIPRCGFRLTTVGSFYWMSPECLKGEWYDQSSDVFSYGIILCEMIGRVEADPDVLPRTENFGLDYIAFTKLCTPPPPPASFLKLAFTSCSYEPKSRPSFSEIVLSLEQMMADDGSERTGDPDSGEDCGSKTGPPGSLGPHPKLCHRRSFSDDGLRLLGETMAQQDAYYKPTQLNPFVNMGLKGKVAESGCGGGGSCGGSTEGGTVVAEPVVKPSQLLSSLKAGPSSANSAAATALLDSIFSKERSSLKAQECELGSRDVTELSSRGSLILLSSGPGHGRSGSAPLSLPSSPTFGRRSHCAPKLAAHPRASFKPLRSCSSGSNLVSLDDHHAVLKRRGSCESGFFSSVGDDFGHPGLELVASSSVTLSSSSAASSLLLDSHTGSEALAIPQRRQVKRASSVYTDSSEDISNMDPDTEMAGSHQIHKMVEYFERKQTAEPNEYYRQLRHTYERGAPAMLCPSAPAGQCSGPQSLSALPAPPALHDCRRRLAPAQRLIVCQGAVSSKLQLFDRK